jgi:hypothetical protein
MIVPWSCTAEFDRVNAINLRGVSNCMKYELRQMRKQGSGAGQGNLPHIQVWGDRANSKCGARICFQRNPHQCSVSGYY